MHDHTRRRFLVTTAVTAVATLAGCLGTNTDEWSIDRSIAADEVIQYQQAGCACCDEYAEYVGDHLAGDMAVSVVDDLGPIKDDLGIDRSVRSCHTLLVDGYIVEGHVPIELVEGMLVDRPDIDGIALPGMPPGSPGMTGRKDGTWTIYELRSGRDPGTYETV